LQQKIEERTEFQRFAFQVFDQPSGWQDERGGGHCPALQSKAGRGEDRVTDMIATIKIACLQGIEINFRLISFKNRVIRYF
jgi:hypothetical protein